MQKTLPSINLLLKEKNRIELGNILNTFPAFEIADLIANKKLDDQILVFSILNPKLAVDTFDYLPIPTQKNILYKLPPEQLAFMLKEMSPDDRTNILEELPRPVVEKYIKLLPSEEQILSRTLLSYPEDSVGRMMTTDYLGIKLNWTIEKVLDHIRSYGHDSETINVLYVIDDNKKLIDDIKIKDFLFVPKDYKVSQIANFNFIALSPYDKAEEAIKVFQTHSRGALPVIDSDGEMLGIVTIDDILRLASEMGTEDLQKVGGTEALDLPYLETSLSDLIKKRARWLVVLFIGELFTASAMGFYEHQIEKAVVLALFLPLIISSGGNAGSQSSTLIIRAMALGEVTIMDWFRVMKREIITGLILGIILGIVGFFRVTLWGTFSDIYGSHWLLIAFTIFFSLIGVVLWGSLSGSMLPLILKKFRVDPATSSAPLVATLADVIGIIIYFTVAIYFLHGTLL